MSAEPRKKIARQTQLDPGKWYGSQGGTLFSTQAIVCQLDGSQPSQSGLPVKPIPCYDAAMQRCSFREGGTSMAVFALTDGGLMGLAR